ncbi:MAG: class I SAM-dependent methyltransferase [Halobacteriota archaeon]|nr:class I SAM-dependent methyltransferase [Halobacteriota archaeon]
MKFYSDFADKYDVMITWSRREELQAPFFRKVFDKHNVKSVLDCACGTGFHTIMLSKMGYHVEGCDITPGMIEKSRLNAAKDGLNLNFVQSDFKEMVGKFDKKFEVDSTDYNPISKDKLSDLMKRAGFGKLKFYGDFDFTEFDERKSENLIVVGIKG